MANRRRLRGLLLALFLSLAPGPAGAQTNAVNLTSKFLKGGVRVDHLLVYSLSGIVVIRGSTSDRSRALEAGRFARKLGYKRVANLIQITPPSDDAGIVRAAERYLALERSLDGCRFHIESRLGVVHLTGQIHRDGQRNIAVNTVRRIDGVKEVRTTLSFDQPPPPAPRKRSR